MRYCFLILLLFISLPVFAQNVLAPQTVVGQDKGVLVRTIVMEGFVLGEKSRFIKIFKPYRDKYLTSAQMDVILEKIRHIYEEEGYQQLVSINYKLIKHKLVFTALMTS